MTNAQIQIAAEAAVRAMDPKARAAFIAMFEAGQHDATQNIAQAYAVEGVCRQTRLASMALESGRVMGGLVRMIERGAA